ncbi:MAG: hypothetical protein HDR80_08415 [Bacteroides sp.]|nr:hypothetical protein [Bacteroides sp.]
MITDEVIQEIYRTNKRPPKNLQDLKLPEAIFRLRNHHNMVIDSDDLQTAEVIINDLEEYNPFRRFLVRSLHAVLEFDKMIAFVFRNHILFLGKNNEELRVHFKPDDEEDEEEEEDGRSFLARLFGRR